MYRTASILFTTFILVIMLNGCSTENAAPNVSTPQPAQGTGGSLARFALSSQFLYVVDDRDLITFDIQNPMQPEMIATSTIGLDVETLFAMDTLLFIGTQTGMHIYSIANPSSPAFLSIYEHVVACDPVVAQDTLAYVTLRSGTNCRQAFDQLEVIDIRDVTDPKLLLEKPMNNPHGLGVDDTLLFVTEGDYGLKVFDINSPYDVSEISYFTNVRSFDVIPINNILIVTGPDGIYQYDYSNPEKMTLLSKIDVDSFLTQ